MTVLIARPERGSCLCGVGGDLPGSPEAFLVRDLLPITDARVVRVRGRDERRAEAEGGSSERAGPALLGASGRASTFRRRALAEPRRSSGAAGAKSRVDASSTTGSMAAVVETARFVEAQAQSSACTRASPRASTPRSRNAGSARLGGWRLNHLRRRGDEERHRRVARGAAAGRHGGGGGGGASRGVRPGTPLRLLLLYAASHPEKFDDAERARWMKLTGLTRATSRRWRIWRGWACASGEARESLLRVLRVGGDGLRHDLAFARQRVEGDPSRCTRAAESEWDLAQVPADRAPFALALDRISFPEVKNPTLGGGGGAGDGGGGGWVWEPVRVPGESRPSLRREPESSASPGPGSGRASGRLPRGDPAFGGGGGCYTASVPPTLAT